ncbi:LicD family-domain-containing protein [Mycena vulgaris]|nr:LicD family-domain-containing protein [Mycena vulgaris]
MKLLPKQTILLLSTLLVPSALAAAVNGVTALHGTDTGERAATEYKYFKEPDSGALVPSALATTVNGVPDLHSTDTDERPATEYKYFKEPDSGILGHYDARYFKGPVVYDEHRAALRHLIRSYLTVLEELGVETWLAHGTLLGWWWKGQIMPWDDDLDVQVSAAALEYLGKSHNRTLHEYRFVDEHTGREMQKTFLLDINPYHSERERLQGQNVIDARWIDVSNGMFIDITALAERDPARHPGVWSCKNFHRYRSSDLYPMHQTEFEGVPAQVPHNIMRILMEEYGKKSLFTTEWHGHRWEPDLKEWVELNSQYT